MNINVQQQNFEQVDSLKIGKENIEDVKNKADDKIKKLEKNPEQKKGIINWIKEKLFANKKDKNEDEPPKTNETEKHDQKDDKEIIGNQGGANLNTNIENTSQ